LKQKLREEQNKNSVTTAILEGGTLIIWAVDTNFNLISFNQNYFNSFMSGQNQHAIAELVDNDLVESKEKDFWSKKYVEALAGQSLNFEIKINLNGEETWKEVFLNPIYESTGEISGVSGLAYDITEKMNSKLALVESEKMFRNIFQSFQDLYFRCNFQGEILMLSPSVADITDYTESELLGKNITNYYLYKAKTKSLLRKLAKNTRVRNFEVEIVHKNGRIIKCICNVRLIFDDRNRPKFIEGVARDITELKETNEKLLVAKELAEESLKVKEQFLANMSHEIRTPLNGIIGMIHLLDSPTLNKEQQRHVKSLKSSSEILLNILNDLLDISKIEAGKMTIKYHPVDVPELMSKINNLYKEQATAGGISLNVNLDSKVPQFIFSDETKILQIFSNLVSNALKFTPEDGMVEVSLNAKEVNKNGTVLLEGVVADTGIGIEEKEQQQLFDSFTQIDSSSKKAYKGTGLGLHISKQLVELFNGNIEVESTPQVGSVFRFYIESSTTRIRPEEKGEEAKISGMPKILVVDDNDINLDLAAVILKKAGCSVTTCTSGAQSLNMVQNMAFDAILMDIQMPDIDGVMATRNIRSMLTTNTPPILAMTAYSMSGDEDKFLNMGFDDYLAKPIKPDLLIHKLQKWLDKSYKIDTVTTTKTDQTQEDGGSINMAVINKLKEYGGEDTIKLALSEFNSECKQQIKDSEKAFQQKNIKEVLNILHTLKGNAGTLGVEKMAAQAELMETELKKEKYSIFEEEISKLKAFYDSFKTDLKSLFNQN
ncbi:PAS domain S-box protein, partial [Fulvivirga sp. RKSG066]|uniref:PAS domain-containing hybrid sensor histidine kinase/response regulator n=1 Tax=Fulvivirga aurantia TaxID=2529383 RepID=UPI0012BC04DB